MKFCIGSMALITALFAAAEPGVCSEAAREAVMLSGNVLLPSLFPFFVCANILLKSGMIDTLGKWLERPMWWLFGIGRGGAAAIPLGFISGYPSGAIVAARLYENGSITKREAEHLLAFTNNPGPMFVMGVIGEGVYGNRNIGIILLSSVILSSVISGMCLRKNGVERQTFVTRKTKDTDPMGQAITAILRLSGFVIFFSVVSAFLRHIGILPMLRGFMIQRGIGEKTAEMISTGVLEVSVLSKYCGALPAMAGLLSFGGISVFLQVWDIARKAGLSVKYYIGGKLLSAGLASFFCSMLLKAFPLTVETAQMTGEKRTGEFNICTAILFGFCIYSLYLFCIKRRKTDLSIYREI